MQQHTLTQRGALPAGGEGGGEGTAEGVICEGGVYLVVMWGCSTRRDTACSSTHLRSVGPCLQGGERTRRGGSRGVTCEGGVCPGGEAWAPHAAAHTHATWGGGGECTRGGGP
jgi:hypothetical protein